MKMLTKRFRPQARTLGTAAAVGTAVLLGSLAACFETAAEPTSAPMVTPNGTADTTAGAFQSEPSALRRLTESQFQNAILDVFGDAIIVAVPPEPDVMVEGAASVGSSVSSISPRGVENLEAIAYDIGKQIMATEAAAARFAPCLVGTPTPTPTPTPTIDAPCLRSIASKYGRRLWRRDVTETELDALIVLATNAGTAMQAPAQSVRFLVAALLQSPEFIYRVEVGSPTPAKPQEHRYSDTEFASRLAFFLWDGPPDEALLDAAKKGDLAKASGLEAQVDRLLADPKARRGLSSFVDEWLHLRGLQDLAKDTTIFTSFSGEVGPAARQEVLLDIQRIALDTKADLRSMFTTRETFVNRKLAALYDVAAPSQTGFGLVTFPSDSPRSGLLGSIGFLAYYAHPTGSSPTKRGAFIRETLLCQTVSPPPANVDTAIPEVAANLRTMRERLLAHQTVPFCAGCHIPIDSVGLPLEGFDGAGKFRKTDNGAPLDLTGELDGSRFDGALQLSELVARHPDFPQCVVKKIHRFAYGHTASKGEQAEINSLTTSFIAGGHRLHALLKSVAMSDSFRIASAPAQGE